MQKISTFISLFLGWGTSACEIWLQFKRHFSNKYGYFWNHRSVKKLLSPQVSGKTTYNQGSLAVWLTPKGPADDLERKLLPGTLWLCSEVQRGYGLPLWLSSPSRTVTGPEGPSVEFLSNWSSEGAQPGWWRDVFFGMRKNDSKLEKPKDRQNFLSACHFSTKT